MHKTKGKNTYMYVVDCSMHDLLVDDMNAEGKLSFNLFVCKYSTVPPSQLR